MIGVLKQICLIIITCIFNIILIKNITFAQSIGVQFNPQKYIVYKTTTPIIMDGSLEDECWEKTNWTTSFVDISGDTTKIPYLSTKAKILWDDANLYIGIEMEEPHIWATIRQRDSIIFLDNAIELFIDPDGDTHNYYEIEFNAYGTVWDLLMQKPYRDGKAQVTDWDIKNLKVAIQYDGSINNPKDTDKKWTIEIGIPWKHLTPFAPDEKIPKQNDQWRINFMRVQWKTEIKNGLYSKIMDTLKNEPIKADYWVWSPQYAPAIHQPETFGFMQFSEHQPGQNQDSFIENPDEKIKWALRRLYYLEKVFYKKNKFYTTDPKMINWKSITIEGIPFNPVIQVTNSMYEITAIGADKKTVWHIRQDGKVWND
jgi:hypothetical protein